MSSHKTWKVASSSNATTNSATWSRRSWAPLIPRTEKSVMLVCWKSIWPLGRGAFSWRRIGRGLARRGSGCREWRWWRVLEDREKESEMGGGDLVGNLILEYLDLPKSLYWYITKGSFVCSYFSRWPGWAPLHIPFPSTLLSLSTQRKKEKEGRKFHIPFLCYGAVSPSSLLHT